MFEITGTLLVIIAIVAVLIIGAIGWYLFMKARYRTVPSNEALIVTGPNLGDETKETNIYKDDQGRYMKVIRGGGHRLKLFQTGTRVSLKSFQLQISTPKVYTLEGVGIYGQAVATVKVADDLDGIVKYAEQFLGKDQDDIEHEISEVLNSNLRAILSKMTVEQINKDRESFNEQVREIAQDQLNRMGFKITSLGLSDLKDDENYLENLGRPQIARVKKAAEIAESENRRETEIQQAKDNEDISNEQYKREMNIADSRKEKDLKDAKILAETEKENAAARAAGQLEEEERRLEVERQRLEIVEQEKQNELKLRQMERENDVALEKQQVEVRRQQAEADYYAQTKEAEARAESRMAEGKAEAEVIREKSLAEAEAIERRAKAMAEHKDVIILEQLIEIMPEFARAVSDSLNNVESIRILDGGKGEQLSSLPNTVTGTMAKLQESMGQMTGFDLEGFLNNLSATTEANYTEVDSDDGGEGSKEDTELTETPEPEIEKTETTDETEIKDPPDEPSSDDYYKDY
ncbi:flotillin family protein [Lacicoccus qingdaonensis]|uniref:Flotillin n=1 Tax=Lacicoccus qingdaonensis TaxID=576118 RepID=A0A1G9E4R1_9BACL|nr:SPFH domain-containing protein [Salinicoccus qingdaonensis]SDK71109.1 flotillin [Salinicoccus qingdaonensis]